MSPERLERNNRELERILVMASSNGERISKLEKCTMVSILQLLSILAILLYTSSAKAENKKVNL